VTDVAFSPDGQTLAVIDGLEDRQARRRDTGPAQETGPTIGPQDRPGDEPGKLVPQRVRLSLYGEEGHNRGEELLGAEAVDRCPAAMVTMRLCGIDPAASASWLGGMWLAGPPEISSVGAVISGSPSHQAGSGMRSCRTAEVTALRSYPRRPARPASAGTRKRVPDSP
jgi:hypothetical protein